MLFHLALGLLGAGLALPAAAQNVGVQQQYVTFPAHIDGRDYQLECMLYRPADTERHPLVVFSHGRNGPNPVRDPNTVNAYAEICRALAAEGCVVAYFVRRGYGNSEGADTELQDTAVLSGLEAAKDYLGAVEYWRTKEFVLPDRVVLMGQSQGGWAVLASATVRMPGVLGAVNISGGTNYRLMGTGAVTSAVQDHWVAGCDSLGRDAVVPSFWIYSENDQSISGPTARRMFNAFSAHGVAWLLMLPAYGSNGHAIVGQPDLFLPQLIDFLATIGFREAPGKGPVVTAVRGATGARAGDTVALVAAVTGTPLPLLQWRRNGANLTNGGAVAGATCSALTISNIQAADAGNYSLVATNNYGTATSGDVILALETPAPVASTNPPSSGHGGGGGAPSGWCLAALAALIVGRRAMRAMA
ncbi:MAG TPA: immunoglobulin domain-containing protein [Lacunisphaera sp.]|nr:immunoglobulin domain-containing protein [Lacunisphaera sp.]